MGRGITETNVFEAADALVASGERPTVERIRAHLGTGSPNTVTRHLEAWWGGLGTRLQAQRASANLPQAPAEVASLASQWWDLAYAMAVAAARAELDAEHAALSVERDAFATEVAARQAQLELALSSTGEAISARDASEQRLADMQLLIEQLHGNVADMALQRDKAAARSVQLEEELSAYRKHLTHRDEEAAQERSRHAEYVRMVEDRAHAEVDRARQDALSSAKQLADMRRERDELRQRMTEREGALQEALNDALRDGAAARARADALSEQKTIRGTKSKTAPSAKARRERRVSSSKRDARSKKT